MPIQVFDSHLHVIDPRFPLVPNEGYLPPRFTVDDYRSRTAAFDVIGGVVVSGSFQGVDTTYLLDALDRLGPSFVGVVNVPTDIADDGLRALAAAGVRGIRCNLYRGGSTAVTDLVALGRRAWDVAGMHVELYLDAADLAELEPVLRALPRASVDHLGMTHAHRDVLLRLVERGLRVKATGFGRVDLDVRETLAAVHRVDPRALLFGTDLPSTRARRPFRDEDVAVAVEGLDPDDARAVLVDNAVTFYRVGTPLD
ncbi:amidohydrolase family protein [Curtobacterium sp. MCBD17_035]|uniref:amidohydrolase family protein n=1 Tax=Curtobacterium sp. MCBD17_035 TaxID=2175673 RepID=UPI000DA977BB|nr:amidohydrolase family protein [Curtobacterium sp. MCBD17_035]WIB67256.1 amidohydrolase family protein [Curtobacterium sp. MCBD17_035]